MGVSFSTADRGAAPAGLRNWARWVLISLFSVMLAACGGGGGGGSGGGSVAPTGFFTATPQSGSAPLAVSFDATSSTAGSGTLTQYNWNFGDNSSGTGVTVSHTYTAAGTYTASLTVKNSKGATSTAVTRTITVAAPTGTVAVTVTDAFSTPVPNVAIQVSIGGSNYTGTTGANGVATITGVPTGSATVNATLAGFVTPTAKTVTVAANTTASTSFQLMRVTEAAGGFITAQAVPGGVVSPNTALTFDLTVIVIDKNGVPIPDLTGSAFSLKPCAYTAATPSAAAVECVRGTTASYNQGSLVGSVLAIPGGTRQSFYATLLIDQSGSIKTSDPTNARIFATKEFLNTVTSNGAFPDEAELAAFAASVQGAPALIPSEPVSYFGKTTNGSTLFGALDSLAGKESGNSPIYRALDQVIDRMRDPVTGATNAAGRAIVLFTDGQDQDTFCTNGEAACRAAIIAKANQLPKVDIFTVGLSNQINAEALAALSEGGNGYFLFAENAAQLIPIYQSLGALLSKSQPTYKMRWTINSASTGLFVTNSTVLGTLQITLPSSTVTLPFAIRL